MSNLVRRVLTAVVAIPLLAGLILWDRREGFAVLVLVCSALGMRELTAMLLPDAGARVRGLLIVISVGLTLGLILRPDLALGWILAALIAVATVVLLAPGPRAAGAGGTAAGHRRAGHPLRGGADRAAVVAAPSIDRGSALGPDGHRGHVRQ
jgi:CDP-diglyceride synthetase